MDEDGRIAHVQAQVPIGTIREDPVAEERGVVVAHERAATLDIRDDVRAAPGGERQVHRGRLTGRSSLEWAKSA